MESLIVKLVAPVGAFQFWGRFPKSLRGVPNWHFLAPQAGFERFLACPEARWRGELSNSPPN
jgi:hypothetical protein